MALGGLFGGSGNSTPVTSSTVSPNSQVKEQLKAQIGQELAIANATELVNKITENCFEQCQRQPFGTTEEVSFFLYHIIRIVMSVFELLTINSIVQIDV